MSDNRFIKSARLVSFLTLLSRIMGLFRDAICSRYFGAEVLHYFYLPFKVCNLSRRIFGEGALAAALIPVYTEQLHHDKGKAKLLARSVVTLLVIILAAITLLGLGLIFLYWEFFSDQAPKSRLVLSLTAIMLPYMILICSVAAIGGILNVHRHFGAPAAAPIILNLCIIGGVWWFRGYLGESLWEQIYVISYAVLIAGFLQLAVQYPALRSVGVSLRPRFNWHDEGLKKIFVLLLPMIVGLATVQINTLFDDLIAFFLSASAESGPTFVFMGRTIAYPVSVGSITYLYYAQRCYHFPLGVFGIALSTAIFPVLSRCAVKKDHKGFAETLGQGVRIVVLIAVPCTVGLVLVRLMLVEAIFEGNKFTARDSVHTADTLFFYALGILPFFLQQLVVRAFYSYQDSATPVKVAMCMVGVNFVMNLVLIWPLGTGGLALATAGCSAVQVIILLVILMRRYHLNIAEGLVSTGVKTVGATIVMAGCGWWLMNYFAEATTSLRLTVVVAGCIISYVLVSLLLKNSEVYSVLRLKR